VPEVAVGDHAPPGNQLDRPQHELVEALVHRGP
jgi:hypothetical protein